VKISEIKKKAKDDTYIITSEYSDNNYWKLAPQYDIDQLIRDQVTDAKKDNSPAE
jgi:hypothetical protein